jgi:hypothetical protein
MSESATRYPEAPEGTHTQSSLLVRRRRATGNVSSGL